jgi:hypothetical protein
MCGVSSEYEQKEGFRREKRGYMGLWDVRRDGNKKGEERRGKEEQTKETKMREENAILNNVVWGQC